MSKEGGCSFGGSRSYLSQRLLCQLAQRSGNRAAAVLRGQQIVNLSVTGRFRFDGCFPNCAMLVNNRRR
jgi:hypothetical protein